MIVQKYISGPFLISGYKFDLRVYVCVKGFRPLMIYMHQEGLVRFAAMKYDLASLDNPNCVELFGFDILIDSNFKPWLLEVNYSPALSLDCPVEIKVKKRV